MRTKLFGLALGVSICTSLAPDDSVIRRTVLPQIVLPQAQFIQYEEPLDREVGTVEILPLVELDCAPADRCTSLTLPALERKRPQLEF